MKDPLIEKRIGDIVKFLSAPDGFAKQAEGITQIKKSKALGNFGFAIVLIVLGALASIYGIADAFGGKTLPMGVLFLIGGPIVLVGGAYMVFSSLARAATAPQVTFETDLQRLCGAFYTSVFCKKTTDLESKDDQIVDVCQFIPVPILRCYTKRGWKAHAETGDRNHGHASGVKCDSCGRESSSTDESELDHLRANQDRLGIRTIYLECEDCHSQICNQCLGHSSPRSLL